MGQAVHNTGCPRRNGGGGQSGANRSPTQISQERVIQGFLLISAWLRLWKIYRTELMAFIAAPAGLGAA
jgi:hypothetical protein